MRNSPLLRQLVFWGVWIVIPFLWEVAVGIVSGVTVFIRYFSSKEKIIGYYPRITVLIPVYNSQNTLEKCITSVLEQQYPKEMMEIILIDNGSTDSSYDIFARLQSSNPEVRLWWNSSSQGKSKALNRGIFASTGKYIVNIDSDGMLDSEAILNIVVKFENNNDISCMTGVVLTDPDAIKGTNKIALKLLRLSEFFEYVESFLVGRNFYSMFNSMYTLAGAFSAFRREALLKTQMYSSETMGEDTHMTFQIKTFLNGRVALCEKAFFYTEPIDSFDSLYIQRQRWQRGELEVASLFSREYIGDIKGFFTKPAIRQLISNHTLAFPRLIWFLA